MTELFASLSQAVMSLVAVYLLALWMRRRGVLDADHSMALARIVTDLCLPAVVFVHLARQKVLWDQMGPALTMLGAELACIAIAWSVCRSLGFSRAKTGAVVFCSAFGSSTFLGYAVIMEVFPKTPEAMTEAVLVSEIGVGYPIFILGPILAAWFGSGAIDVKDSLKNAMAFFKSPVFFALLLGLAWTPMGLPGEKHLLVKPLFEVSDVLGRALTPLAILAVGLMFKVPDLKTSAAALAVVVAIKLFLKPLGLGVAADALDFPKLWKDVLVILGAMPPAVLGAVFLRRYGGDAALASALLLAGTLLSAMTILIVFFLVG